MTFLKNMDKRILIVFFGLLFFLQDTKADELPSVRLKFSVFKDTIVTGFDTEFQLSSGYDSKKISITATGCSIMLKDAEKGIYVVKAPTTSVGKTSVITVSIVNSNGSVTEVAKFNIPVVAMTTEMRKRYVNNLTHKK